LRPREPVALWLGAFITNLLEGSGVVKSGGRGERDNKGGRL